MNRFPVLVLVVSHACNSRNTNVSKVFPPIDSVYEARMEVRTLLALYGDSSSLMGFSPAPNEHLSERDSFYDRRTRQDQ